MAVVGVYRGYRGEVGLGHGVYYVYGRRLSLKFVEAPVHTDVCVCIISLLLLLSSSSFLNTQTAAFLVFRGVSIDMSVAGIVVRTRTFLCIKASVEGSVEPERIEKKMCKLSMYMLLLVKH